MRAEPYSWGRKPNRGREGEFAMSESNVSRRQFAATATAAAAGLLPQFASAADLTARQVIDRIRANVGVPWAEKTVDTFKAGNPDTPVKGIATTCMATLDLLQRAAAAGKN